MNDLWKDNPVMTKHQFTLEQTEKLSANPYVERITATKLYLSDTFYKVFFEKNDPNKSCQAMMDELGLGKDLLGPRRGEAIASRLRQYDSYEDYQKAKQPSDPTSGMSDKQLIKHLKNVIEVQKEEIDLLKKKKFIRQLIAEGKAIPEALIES